MKSRFERFGAVKPAACSLWERLWQIGKYLVIGFGCQRTCFARAATQERHQIPCNSAGPYSFEALTLCQSGGVFSRLRDNYLKKSARARCSTGAS